MTKDFVFEKYHFNDQTGVLTLAYRADNQSFFEEKITFPGAPFSIKNQAVLDKCFRLLHVAAGVSYYKAVLADNLIIETQPLLPKEATFFEKFYLMGLGQFAYQNGLDLRGKIHFPSVAGHFDEKLVLDKGIFVPVGGGKDSCVTMELLKKENPTAISVNTAKPIEDCKRISGLDNITILREISPELLDKSKSFYNGHVPITGILAFVMMAACVLYGKNEIAMSCESSANEGNLKMGGMEINHQWSKSEEFERMFMDLVHDFLPNFKYYSFLRAFREIDIARLFAQNCSAYFEAFTSCNHAFHIDKAKRLDRWCGDCDKCRFVFLILAPFMDKKVLTRVVGHDLLDDERQKQGYRELLGLSGHKPFECVGTVDECREAFAMLCTREEWQNDKLVRELADEL